MWLITASESAHCKIDTCGLFPCREVRDAARVMGNTALFQQMEAAQAAIKRDVIFAASLYVT